MKQASLAVLFTITSLSLSFAQELKLPAMSPTARISQDFSTSNIEISYSRPSMRGRKVFGEVVAYGNAWRTGANGPTKVKFGEDVMVGGQEVKAGEYSLYTIPGREEWEVVLSKAGGPLDAKGYNRADDVARFNVIPKRTENSTETFTINISNIKFNACNIDLMWEKTKVTIPVKANNEERLNASIEKAISNPNIPYYQAANYYYETGQNLNQARMYIDKAVAANPQAFYMWYLKAKIAQKQGNKEEALEAAQRSIATSKGTANEAEYQRNNQKIINSYK
jgi:hypothetical protein